MRIAEKRTTTAVRAALYRVADKRKERERERAKSRGQTRHNPRLPSPATKATEDSKWGNWVKKRYGKEERRGKKRGLRAVCHLVVFAAAIVVIALPSPTLSHSFSSSFSLFVFFLRD